MQSNVPLNLSSKENWIKNTYHNAVTNILKNHMSTILDKTDNILDFCWPSVPGFPSRWLWLRISLLVFEWLPRSAAPRKLSRQFLVWGSTGRVDESGRKPGLPKHNRLLDDGFLGKKCVSPNSILSRSTFKKKLYFVDHPPLTWRCGCWPYNSFFKKSL